MIPSPPQPRKVPMLVRLDPAQAEDLRVLARRTRVRQADYLREAVGDLLVKYRRHLLDEAEAR